ncbi:hypothetical protein JOY44_01425 [Phormidium sp. CLA17]|uniref:hypothetical protein n=1 Tax=Leptolyngbya sp. Cla-17 TaxID=2803751 RepID=UPI00149312A4|nr:hypothetical protein [Leptolyngbya sp. Cla-17]MBM0740290.1 hypothetical protein [Leptolyngbya sp. Cla-17]
MSEHRLSEIVIERPRGGRRTSLKKLKGFKKQLNQLTQDAAEDGLFNSYLIKPRKKTKYLSDHLGPLRRFLRSHVGQPWNTVHSKLCQQLDSNTMAGRHVLDHVKDYVVLHVEWIDDILYGQSQWGGRTRLDRAYRDQFYVDPKTGILCAVQRINRKEKSPTPPTDVVVIDVYHQYHKLNEIWYLVTFTDFPPLSTEYVVDILGQISSLSAVRVQGRRAYASHKRQCNKKEIRFILSRFPTI